MGDNDAITVGMLEALRHVAGGAPVVWVSSCEVYGAPAVLPATEEQPMRPANPYAVSKASGEMLAEVYADAYGLEIARARPFSHSGPGQLPIFLLSSLASQAAEGRRAGVSRLEIVTGNPDTRRDFTDVRDVVRAYRLLGQALASGKPGAAGGVFNVSTGTLGVRGRAGRAAVRAPRAHRGPAHRRPGARPGQRGHGPPGRPGPAARADRLGARRSRCARRWPTPSSGGSASRRAAGTDGSRRRSGLSGLHASRAGSRLPDFATAAPA